MGRRVIRSDLHIKRILLAVTLRKVKGEKDDQMGVYLNYLDKR